MPTQEQPKACRELSRTPGRQRSKGAERAAGIVDRLWTPAGPVLYAPIGRPDMLPARPPLIAEGGLRPRSRPALDPSGSSQGLRGPADIILRGGQMPDVALRGNVASAIAVRAGRSASHRWTRGPCQPLRGRLTRVIDLDGQALVPGFVIADWHPPVESPVRLAGSGKKLQLT